ncbi:hypothetical protein Bca4012_068629 [Brassica carinata]
MPSLIFCFRYGSGVYGADVFDRIWLPYNSDDWSRISTNNSVDNDNGLQVPENVMATASVPTDPDAHMNISLTGLYQTSRFYAFLHFSEIQELNPNDTREFKVMYNGRLIIEPFKPKSFYTDSFIRGELGPNANGQCTFSLQKTASSTLPPLLNAMEVYIVNSLSQNETDAKEDDDDDNNLQQCNNQSSSSEMANNMFTYEDLAQATDNFSYVNFIGQGGFGYVHKGVLHDGTEVAIKQLKAGSGQGEREFRAEIEIISRVHHRHLVSLLGYCVTGTQRLLVYEFLPNKTLEFHLHGNPKTIHRDVKAANVLIDDSYEAKLADFGLAKCCLDNDTHVSTRIMGTCGYLAPEYASSGKLSDKSDVFSFGVMLLELITGRRPVAKSHPFADEENIVDWAKPLMIQALNTGNFHGLVDPRLEKDFDISEIKRMVLCADACVQHSAKHRPKMSQIVRAFDKSISLDDLIQGVALGDITSYSLDENSDYSSTKYKEDVKKFKRLILESQTFGTSGLTSDNGQSSSGSFCTKSET